MRCGWPSAAHATRCRRYGWQSSMTWTRLPSQPRLRCGNGLDKPRATVDRQLQALHMLGVLTPARGEAPHQHQVVLPHRPWNRPERAGRPSQTFTAKPTPTPDPQQRGSKGQGIGPVTPGGICGKSSTNGAGGKQHVFCRGCHTKLPNRESITRGTCYQCHTATK